MQAIGRLGQLLQPGAVRPADDPAVGHRDRLRPPGRRLSLRRRSRSTTTHFQPLFLYESLSGSLGAIVLLWLARRTRHRGSCPATCSLIFFIWYGSTRFVLESCGPATGRSSAIPTAQIVTLGFILVGLVAHLVPPRAGPAEPRRRRRRCRGPRRRADDDLDDYALEPDLDASDAASPGRLPARPHEAATPRRPDVAGGAATRPRAGAGRRPAGSRPRRSPTPAAAPSRASTGWAGRPSRKASLLYRVAAPARPGDPVRRCSGSGSRRPARSTCRPAATSSSARPIAAGWTRSSSSTRCPTEPRVWFLGSAPVDVHVALAGGAHPPPRRAAAGLARRDRRRAARRVGPGGHRATAASSPRCRRARSAGRPAGSGRSAVGWALIALRTGAPIVPLAMAGTEELYLGKRMASRILPRDVGRRSCSGRAGTASLPAEGIARGARPRHGD